MVEIHTHNRIQIYDTYYITNIPKKLSSKQSSKFNENL